MNAEDRVALMLGRLMLQREADQDKMAGQQSALAEAQATIAALTDKVTELTARLGHPPTAGES